MIEWVASLALGVAQDALRGIFTDFILNGRKKRLSDSDIRGIVLETIQQQQAQLESAQQKQVRELAVEEIGRIIAVHPGLVVEKRRVSLAPEIGDHARQVELRRQIGSLSEIIRDRRRQLGLPLTESEAISGSAAPSGGSHAGEASVTRQLDAERSPSTGESDRPLPDLLPDAPTELPSYWRQRAEETRKNLAAWRSGELPPPAE